MSKELFISTTEYPTVCLSPEDLKLPSVKTAGSDPNIPRPVITEFYQHIQDNQTEVIGTPAIEYSGMYPELENQSWRFTVQNKDALPEELSVLDFPFNFKTGFATILDFATAVFKTEVNSDKLVDTVYSSMAMGEPLIHIGPSIYHKYKNPKKVDLSAIVGYLDSEGFVRFEGSREITTVWLKFNHVNLPYMMVTLTSAPHEKSPFLVSMTSKDVAEKLLSLIVPQLVPVEIPLSVSQLTGYRNTAYGNHPIYDKMALDSTMDYALPEFYPWIKMGLKEYFEEYFKSRANVLVMIGSPGTGKSTLIRTIIRDLKVRSMLVYKTSVIQNDGFINVCQEFLSENRNKERANAVIVEDGDAIMGKREDGNHHMAEILNATSGICSDSNSKFILSTNLESIRNIDPALLRPGRCFDILCFRALTAEEATIVRKARGLPPMDFNPKEKYVLAEVLNDAVSHGQVEPIVQPRFGFNNS